MCVCVYTTYRNGPTASNARTHTRRYMFVRSGRGERESVAGKLREALQCPPPFFFFEAAHPRRRRREKNKEAKEGREGGSKCVCCFARRVCASRRGGGGRFTTLPRR